MVIATLSTLIHEDLKAMSKRGADSQRMGETEEFISTGPQMEGNNKATAAQMANRR